MLSNYEIALIVLGAVLILAAIGSGWLPGTAAGTTAGRVCRGLAGVAGAALIAWALLSHLAPGGLVHSTPAVDTTQPHGPTAADLVRTASTALQACPAATAPAEPDGAKASLADMEAAVAAYRAYDAATIAYTKCVDATVERVGKQFTAVAGGPDLEALTLFGERAHNVAIDREQRAVDQFNAQLQIYKAKHRRP